MIKGNSAADRRASELRELYPQLTPMHQMELVLLARRLQEEEHRTAFVDQMLSIYKRLNVEGRKEFWKIFDDLNADPQYRR